MGAFVVTGTGSGIGKTAFSAALAGALGAHYWKPVQAGLVGGAEATDSETVARLANLPAAQIVPETYRLAARLPAEGTTTALAEDIDIDRLILPTRRPLVIEGTGSALQPLARGVVFADVLAEWGLLTVLVAPTAPGSFDHSLLMIDALHSRRVPLHGVAFVGAANEALEASLTERGEVRRLGRLPDLGELSPAALAEAFATGFDIDDFA
ncbi:MAG: dethiobiotin synthase [Novosphingobium sp.]|uniref:dethiobiotin synthase n=1 Tax=Novosphingobium sp. TaxID=1874826 RepID=UPI00301A4D48